MNEILLDLGFIVIRWYSVLVLLGFIVGYILVLNKAKKNNISIEKINDMCFYLIVFGILGARTYYCLFNLDYYGKNLLDIFKIWEGGLAIHGGIIAGIIFLIIYSKKNKIKIIKLLDMFAPSLVIGQAIGRWGNFFNQEAYGTATSIYTLKKLHIPQFIINGMKINGVYYHPTFFYESLGCILIFIILILIEKKRKNTLGIISSIYLILYGILRFFIEILRQDSLMLYNIKIAQLISIIMIIIGVILLLKQKNGVNYDK